MSAIKNSRRVIIGSVAVAALCGLALEPSKSSRLVSAAAGGILLSPSGRAELTIPSGALEADCEVTITELPPGEGPAVGPVFDMQPDGLRFSKPATLTVRYKPGEVPKGRRPEDVSIMQVLPGPEAKGQSGIGAAAAAAARPPYQSLKTTVDAAAGTATAQLTHLSRYAARSYATFDLQEWNASLSGPFDFGQENAEHSGAADARSAYGLDGGLELTVQVPLGREGQGWAWACLWQTFRVVPRQPAGEEPWFGNRDIEIPIVHRGRVEAGTNTYDVHYTVWLASDRPGQPGITAGEFFSEGQSQAEGILPEFPETPEFPPMLAFQLPGIFWRSFSIRPGMRASAAWSPTPYKAERGKVVFKNVPLYRDHFYAIGVSLFAAIKGGPGRGKRPPEGGAVSFLFGDFTINPVQIRKPI